jgi:DNA-binding LacI/PurR family transcriptional regulator
MMKNTVTLKDIAEKTGVSIKAVSSAINGTGRLSPETRERILVVSRELGYRPNIMARGLQGKKTFLIGAVFPYVNESFFNHIIGGLEKRCTEAGYDLLLGNSSTYDDRNLKTSLPDEIRTIHRMVERGVDGIVTFPHPRAYDLYAELAVKGPPCVFAMRKTPGVDLPFLGVDNVGGAYAAVVHLLQLGHRRIGFLGSASENHGEIDSRRTGWIKALLEWGVAIKLEEFEEPCAMTYENGYEAARRLIAKAEGLTAIFASTDYVALGTIRACRDLGLTVPGHISVVGFDDIELARYQGGLQLTSVAQPKEEIGFHCFDMLKQAIDGERPQDLLLDPRLVVRETTSSPSGGARGEGPQPGSNSR